MILKLVVTGNNLSKDRTITAGQVTSNSVNYTAVQFTFNSEWTGLNKTAIFKQADKIYEVVLTSNTCNIPQQVLSTFKELQIGIIGTGTVDNSPIKITTNYVYQKITEGATGGVSAGAPTADVYSQLLSLVQSANTKAQTVLTAANNHEFDGCGIENICCTGTQGNVDTYTITLSDDTTSTFTVTNGATISSIVRTNRVGNVDTYTITMSNGSTSTFEVTNGITPMAYVLGEDE